MNSRPHRTHATFVDDDEILLLDALAPYRSMLSCLRAETYAFQANCDYSHSLTDPQLVDRIETFALCRLVSIRTKVSAYRKSWHPMPWAVGLTADGADLWESERTPNWMRFVTSYGRHDPEFVSLASPSQDALRECISVGVETGRFCVDLSRVRWSVSRNCYLWYWKQFDTIHTMTVPRRSGEPPLEKVDWKAHEQKRSWWSRVPHLADRRFITS